MLTPSNYEARDELRDRILIELKECLKGINSWNSSMASTLPCSLTKQTLKTIVREEYLVSEKIDGVRFTLFMTKINEEPCMAFIARNEQIFLVSCDSSDDFFSNKTILEGELVTTIDPSTNLSMLTFYIFDTVLLAGVSLLDKPITERLHLTHKLIDTLTIHNTTKLEFVRKSFLPLREIQTVLRHSARVDYPVDGLILQPKKFSASIFKWKPDNTIDILVSCMAEKLQIFYLEKGKLLSSPFAFQQDTVQLKLIQNKFLDHIKSIESFKGIIECSIDKVVPGFIHLVPLNVRNDKTKPNSRVTIQRTLKSFTDLLNLQDIISFCTS